MTEAIGFQELANLNDRYARCIDENQLEEWPDFFSEHCLYKVTTADNVRRGYQAGLIYADTRAMLHDRIASLRQANVYEPQRYRHVISAPAITAEDADGVDCETAFLIIRIMRDGTLSLFATGKYVDRIVNDNGKARINRRVVVCDGGNVDTLLAIPL
jgi:3-phenylpropionate/cinnamic acid dioxygenase small subunit